jgi:hypothetical protein
MPRWFKSCGRPGWASSRRLASMEPGRGVQVLRPTWAWTRSWGDGLAGPGSISTVAGARRCRIGRNYRRNRAQFAPLLARGWAQVRSGGYEVLRSEWRPGRNGRIAPQPTTSLSHNIRGPPRALTFALCRQAARSSSISAGCTRPCATASGNAPFGGRTRTPSKRALPDCEARSLAAQSLKARSRLRTAPLSASEPTT